MSYDAAKRAMGYEGVDECTKVQPTLGYFNNDKTLSRCQLSTLSCLTLTTP